MKNLNILIVEGNLKEENQNFLKVGIQTHTESLKDSLNVFNNNYHFDVINPSSDQNLDEVKNKFISLKPGEVIDINNLVNFFVSNGYEKTPTVREHGEFSVRGGIIDFYSPLNKPIRLDLFGNTIDSIKSFDLITQRSLELLKEIFVYPASEIILNDKTIENFRINFNKKFGSQKEKVKIYDSISEGISYPGMEHWLPFFYNQTTLSEEEADLHWFLMPADQWADLRRSPASFKTRCISNNIFTI